MINEELAKLIPETGVILILGERGSGKSVLAYSILEYFCNKRNLFVFRFPRPEILPSFIQVTYDPDFPDGGVVLVDEAYITFSARKAMSRKNKFIDMLNGLARQKDLLVIYITQDSTRVDVNIIRSADVLMIKRLSKRQVEFERKELKSWLKKVKEAIDRIGSLEEIRRSVYVDSDIFGKEFSGIVRNCITLPSFWSEEISKAWRNISLNQDGLEALSQWEVDRILSTHAFERIFRQVMNEIPEKGSFIDWYEECQKEALRRFLRKYGRSTFFQA